MTEVQVDENQITIDIVQSQIPQVHPATVQNQVVEIDNENIEVVVSGNNTYNLTIQGATTQNPQIVENTTQVDVTEDTTTVQASPHIHDHQINVQEQVVNVETVTCTYDQVNVIVGDDLIQNIKLEGDVTGGTGTNTIQTELESLSPDPSGSYTAPNLTVDSKGRVTSASSQSLQDIGASQTNYFTVQNQGENVWSIPTSANLLISVIINQIDYVEFCTLNTSTGAVNYNDTGLYKTEVGDSVIVTWRN